MSVNFASHVEEVDEPSVNINLYSKVRFLWERWRNDDIQKEAVTRSMRAQASNSLRGLRTDFRLVVRNQLCLRTLCLMSHEFSREKLGFSIHSYQQPARRSLAVPRLAKSQVSDENITTRQAHKNSQLCILYFDSETQGAEQPDS